MFNEFIISMVFFTYRFFKNLKIISSEILWKPHSNKNCAKFSTYCATLSWPRVRTKAGVWAHSRVIWADSTSQSGRWPGDHCQKSHIFSHWVLLSGVWQFLFGRRKGNSYFPFLLEYNLDCLGWIKRLLYVVL